MPMSPTSPQAEGSAWVKALRPMLDRRVLAMSFLGFSAGIPLLLIFSSLSLWLREAGVDRGAVTFFSWAALGYSFKFVWAPLIDRLPLPWLSRWLGRRRAWLLVAQVGMVGAILLMASIDPAQGQGNLSLMALGAVLLGFTAATQDIVIDAYRIEVAETSLQAMMSATYIAGYRVGMVVSGAGALYLAAALGSTAEHYVFSAWRWTYVAMAATIMVGIATTLSIPEPPSSRGQDRRYGAVAYLRLVSVFAGAAAAFVAAFFLTGDEFSALNHWAGDGPLTAFLAETLRFLLAILAAGLSGWLLVRLGLVETGMARETWISPVLDFFNRYGPGTALLLLALIGLYRISDVVLGVISNVFYQDLGFTKPQIATAVKTFGVIVSIAGGLVGGLMAARYGVMRILMLGAILSAATNLVFVWLAWAGNDATILYLAVAADNLAAGLASAAFVAFLSSLTSVAFTAVQYAIFSSLMTLVPKVLGGYSGTLVGAIGYPAFFVFTTLIGVPVLLLVWLAGRHLLPSNSSGPPSAPPDATRHARSGA